MEYPSFTQKHKSLMRKYLTNDIFKKLKTKITKNGFTIEQAINSGVKNPDSNIGIYAGDKESYKIFSIVFDKVIEEYHDFDKDRKHLSNLNSEDLNTPYLEELDNYIVSTRIRVGRNFDNMPLGPAISKEQRDEIQSIVSNTLSSFEGSLKGKYFSLEGMKEEDRLSLIDDHFLFKAGDSYLEEAGLNRDWPSGRGIFHNNEKTFLVWVNEEDHLRIISMQKGGNIKEVFQRLIVAIQNLEEKIEFSYDEHLGYITSCPTNLGTAMRASVHIKLPKLSLNMKLLEEIANKHYLQIRGINGEHSNSENGIFDISNKRRLGVTEVQCVQDMYDGVIELIKCEKDL
ncbi:MAG: arginine kinase [Arcobacter sp.]|nr:arginine kinase [Arcobacter sp.]